MKDYMSQKNLKKLTNKYLSGIMSIMKEDINLYQGGNMAKKLTYLFPVLLTFVLIMVSSCRSTNDLAYYYANSTGAGNGNGCCCCGCNNSNENETSTVSTYCEPEAPELVACGDGTITINGYTGLTFATTGDCKSGRYIAAADGIMHLGSGLELLNSADQPLLWIASGSVVSSIATIPADIESMEVLPDGTVIGYVNGTATTLGKLITVALGTIGQCAPKTAPETTIGASVLWCGERVCSSVVSGVLSPLATVASIKVNIPTNKYLTLTQSAFHASAGDIYATGVKDIAISTDGLLIEKQTCMPVLDIDGSQILVPTSSVTDLAVTANAVMINSGVWATLSVSTPENVSSIMAITSGHLSSGFKVSATEGVVPAMVEVAGPVNSVAVEQNVCVDSGMDLIR